MTVIDGPPRHTYIADRIIWPGLDQLATCLCEELIRSGLPKLCFCGVVAGDVAYDLTESDEGIAWVRLVQVFPSVTFPTPASGTATCSAFLTAEVEVGVVRCFAAAKQAEFASEQEQWDQAQLQMADMAAMYRAIQCCYKRFEEFAIGAYVPTGPDGGWVGGTWTVALQGWRQ